MLLEEFKAFLKYTLEKKLLFCVSWLEGETPHLPLNFLKFDVAYLRVQ